VEGTKKIRAFLAAEPPGDLRGAIAAFLREIKDRIRGPVAWVRPEGIHITLKFFGEVAPEEVNRIGAAVAEETRRFSPLEIIVRGLGVFPSPKRPRVIWLGTAGEVDRLATLQGRLEEALQLLGFPAEDRAFRAHLTLGRVKAPLDTAALGEVLREKAGETVGGFTVSSLTLFKSDLTPRGAVYTPLAEFPLGGPQNKRSLP